MGPATKNAAGILLLNLGGPDSLNAVRPFLFNLFSDREIIRLGPAFLQKPLAYLISSLRAKKTENAYSLIGGKSPIFEITSAQAKALEEALNRSGVRSEELGVSEKSGDRSQDTGVKDALHLSPYALPSVKVYVAMRYWHPLIEDVIPAIHKDGVTKLLVISLYPQYSVATTGSSFSRLKKVADEFPLKIHAVESWYDHPLYIDALVEKIRKGIESFNFPVLSSQFSNEQVHVLFSAHSLPVKFIEDGDPYVEHTEATIRAIEKKLDIEWSLSYQSKSGPVKWLEPSTEAKLEELSRRGVRNLLVVPISFVSDHIETLYEIDLLYKKMAEKLGMRLERAESLNISLLFISALRDIVLGGLKEAGWTE